MVGCHLIFENSASWWLPFRDVGIFVLQTSFSSLRYGATAQKCSFSVACPSARNRLPTTLREAAVHHRRWSLKKDYKYKHHCDWLCLDCHAYPSRSMHSGAAMLRRQPFISQRVSVTREAGSRACKRCRLPRAVEAGFLPISAGNASLKAY